SYIIESLTKVINLIFGFVPATIGVYEGGSELILQTLGFAAATGVTLAIIRKAGIVFWTVIGLVVLIWRAAPNIARRIVDRHPGIIKRMDNLVLANFFHRPIRSLTSILGVGVGVLLMIFSVGLAHGVLHENARREANIGAEIIVRPPGTIGLGGGSQPLSLPISRASEILKIEGVKAAVPIAQNFVSSSTGFGSRLLDGVEAETYSKLSGLKVVEGASFSSEDEAIVDSVWQKENKTSIGSTINLYERPFKIVGIYEPPGGGRIKIPLKTMQKQLGDDSLQFCNRILVSCVDPKQQEEVATRIKERFPDDQILFTRDLPELYAVGIPALNIFLAVIVSIAASISMLVILLSMYTSVMERTRQIGILKSLGMSKPLIAWVVQQEALVISVLGVALGIGFAYLARAAIMQNTTLTIVIEPFWIAVSLAIGIVGGSIGALYPALRAARQDAVKALSYD
ncbi:MAG: ABC transporter permease, partial [Pyrinomonadaceae bacterium]